jgi:carbon monoxide dehydrogenase subunit G
VDIEKSMVVRAPIDQVWRLLLDPKVMAGCVPGVQSVQVLSDTDYLADIKVKISFISANFKIKTTILETRPPNYLRCEGTGEDSSVASSLKQTTEMFLTQQQGGTEIRIKTRAEVFGRLGSFGLSVMKTKADRMWEEFGANLAAVLRQDEPAQAAVSAGPTISPKSVENGGTPRPLAPTSPDTTSEKPGRSKWWSRLAGVGKAQGDNLRDLRLPSDIYLEMHRGSEVIKILWPARESQEAVRLLREIIRD